MSGAMTALLLDPDSSLHRALAALAAEARIVFLAGLPGTGKSLLVHQLAQLAHARGRALALLQWDVARPVVEESDAARAFPARGGVTHGVVRIAVGRWARQAVSRWSAAHAGASAMLIGEIPLVGHRLVELARAAEDEAERALGDARTRFVIPVPSREVRRHLEAERERRAARPLHPREREDAPPAVLRDLWRQLAQVGAELGLAGAPTGDVAAAPYDPELYAAVYRHVLRRRRTEVLRVNAVLDASALSPYDLRVPAVDLCPEAAEVAGLVAEAARDWPDPVALQREIDGWYATP
jgi:hypothetical protein